MIQCDLLQEAAADGEGDGGEGDDDDGEVERIDLDEDEETKAAKASAAAEAAAAEAQRAAANQRPLQARFPLKRKVGQYSYVQDILQQKPSMQPKIQLPRYSSLSMGMTTPAGYVMLSGSGLTHIPAPHHCYTVPQVYI